MHLVWRMLSCGVVVLMVALVCAGKSTDPPEEPVSGDELEELRKVAESTSEPYVLTNIQLRPVSCRITGIRRTYYYVYMFFSPTECMRHKQFAVGDDRGYEMDFDLLHPNPLRSIHFGNHALPFAVSDSDSAQSLQITWDLYQFGAHVGQGSASLCSSDTSQCPQVSTFNQLAVMLLCWRT